MAGQAAQRRSYNEAGAAIEAAGRIAVAKHTGKFAWRTVALFFGILAGLSAVSLAALSGILPYWAAIPINALLIYAVFTPLHEAIHSNIAAGNPRHAWAEMLIGHISGVVLLAPYPGLKRLHLHHHQHTNDPKEDPDYWMKASSFGEAVLRCLLIQPLYIIHLYRLAYDKTGKRVFAQEMIYIAAMLSAVAGAYALGFGNALMLLWVLPGYIGVVMCPLFFDWPVHHPHTARGRYTNAGVLLFPKPIRLIADAFFCGHSYHLIHHLYPRVPFYAYGTVYWEIAPQLDGAGFEPQQIGAKAA